MRKRELIYLHGLLDQVSILMRARDDLSEETLDSYRRLNVSPTSVYQPKGDHEQAVETLASALAASVEEENESDEQIANHSDNSAKMT
jgi:hypothetical protein